jgi:hypothetical protein
MAGFNEMILPAAAQVIYFGVRIALRLKLPLPDRTFAWKHL